MRANCMQATCNLHVRFMLLKLTGLPEITDPSPLDCSQSPIFPCDRRCRCGFLNGSETGESTKCPWVEVVEGTAGGKIGRL